MQESQGTALYGRAIARPARCGVACFFLRKVPEVGIAFEFLLSAFLGLYLLIGAISGKLGRSRGGGKGFPIPN